MKISQLPERFPLPFLTALCGMVFFADLAVPRGYAVSILYFIPFLLTPYCRDFPPRRLAALVVPLVVLAGFLKPPPAPLSMVLFNRISGAAVMIGVAFILEKRR